MNKHYAYKVGESWTPNVGDILRWCQSSVEETMRRGKEGIIILGILGVVVIGAATSKLLG